MVLHGSTGRFGSNGNSRNDIASKVITARISCQLNEVDPSMQRLSQRQKDRHADSAGNSELQIPHNSHSPEQECQHSRDN